MPQRQSILCRRFAFLGWAIDQVVFDTLVTDYEVNHVPVWDRTSKHRLIQLPAVGAPFWKAKSIST